MASGLLIAPPPPLFEPVWLAEGDEDGALFGSSIDAADVNGDGYADLVIGAPGAGPAHGVQQDDGAASLYFGSANGPLDVPAWTGTVTTTEDALFGGTVRAAGDVNGDGYEDVAISVARDDYVGGLYDRGTVQVFLGSPTGIAFDWTSPETDQDSINVPMAGGDVDGDGFSDLVVSGIAELRLYTGSASGLTGPLWTSNYADVQDELGLGGFAARAVVLADVDGEGHLDIVVGAPADPPDPGMLFVYPWVGPLWDTIPATLVTDSAPDRGFGAALASGDVNADGYDDVVAGAPQEDTDGDGLREGGAALYLGSASGLALAAWTADPPPPVAALGASVDVGDVNGDGFADVVLGAPGSEIEELLGRAFLWLGSPSGLAPNHTWKEAGGEELAGGFGSAVAFAGDTDGDGNDDLAVAAPAEKHGESEEGRVYLFLGAVVPDADGDGVPDDFDLCTGDDGSGDADADTFCALAADGTVEDCDDNDPATYPGAVELCDGLDSSCAGSLPADEADADADGVRACDGDCGDNDAAVGPGQSEVCGNAIDDDCDSSTTDTCPEPTQPNPEDEVTGGSGCNCATPDAGMAPWIGVALAALVMRRRRRA